MRVIESTGMRMELRHDETWGVPKAEETADVAGRLEAGLAADQAERARLEAKWGGHMRRLVAVQSFFASGALNWLKTLVRAFVGGLVFSLATAPLQHVHEAVGATRLFVPVLIGVLALAWLGFNLLGYWALDFVLPGIREAARREGIELDDPFREESDAGVTVCRCVGVSVCRCVGVSVCRCVGVWQTLRPPTGS